MSQSLCVSLFLSLSARTTSLNVVIVVVIQSLSHAQLFMTPWAAAGQASLSITNSQSLLKHMSVEAVMPSNQLIHLAGGRQKPATLTRGSASTQTLVCPWPMLRAAISF